MSGHKELKIVALGGGHGLAATLSALRPITTDITAVVTVADNGGSSGRLRSEFNIMPPGDLRMALAALCSDDEWGRSWADIMQYRFTSEGELNGHPVGNLLLAALWDRDGDAVAALDRVGELLKVSGRVLPMAAEALDIEATFATPSGDVDVRGQVQVATTQGRLKSLRIIPENPHARTEVLSAIADADLITMGPGSWFSSVLPHLLVPELRSALMNSQAKKVLLLNLDAAVGASHPSQVGKGEFAGHTPLEHLEILESYAPDLHFDFVIADSTLDGALNLREYLSARKTELISADLRSENEPLHHSVEKLTSLFAHIAKKLLV
jgi:uncharacterized cofD-like protein